MSHQPKSNNGNISRLKREENLKNNNEIFIETKMKQISNNQTSNNQSTYFEKKFSEAYYEGGVNYVFTFGSNEMGQLGHEVEMNSQFSWNPILLNMLTTHKITSIGAGDGHTVCVSKEGIVYAWGASACGQLGLDESETMPRDSEGYPFQPTPIPVKLINGFKIKEVACGDAHTLAMTSEGRVFSWGGAGCGQLGHPNINEMPKDADNCPYQPYPRLIETLKTQVMTHIACGKAHSLSIDASGCLFTWGAGACGQLGVEDIQTLPVDDDGYPYQPVPKSLKSLKEQNIKLGVCGDVHTLVLNDKGEVYSFGGGSFGQLGLGTVNKMPLDSDRYPYMPIPTKIESLNDILIVHIACGDSHSMAIDSDGRLYGWGAAACGQLGLECLSYLPRDGEGNPYQPVPKVVSFFENIKVVSISCGEAHTLALVEGGIIYSFGGSTCGQLGYSDIRESKNSSYKSLPKSLQPRNGDGNNFKYEKPRLVMNLLGKNVTKMACGGVHNIILVENQSTMTNNLYNMLKNEQMTDIELVLENVSKNTSSSIKCHKYILISKSTYFLNRIWHDEQHQCIDRLIIQSNVNYLTFKTVIEYLYLDDITFINNFETTSSSTNYLTFLLEYLKIAKLFDLKILQNEIENKLRLNLSKYYEAINNVNNSLKNYPNDENNEGMNSNSDIQFKGICFLPNGSCMVILNEEIIENVVKECCFINFNNSIGMIKNLIQKNVQENNQNFIKSKSLKSQIVNRSVSQSNSIIYLDSEEFSLSLISNLNKTNSSSNFNSKLLYDAFFNNEEFDIYEVLTRFSFMDSDSNNNNGFDLLKYFNKSDTSDITIKVEEKIFYCHKIVLVSSSKYFEMMFSENMKEKSKGEIVIDDYSAADFLYFLIFVYCENITLDIDKALNLLKVFIFNSKYYRVSICLQ